MSLADELAAIPTGPTVSGGNLPPSWTPSVTYAPGGGADVVTIGVGTPGEDWRADVESLGVVIPDGYRVRLVEVRHDPAAWIRHAQGDDATTDSVTRRRYVVEPSLVSSRDTTDDLIASIGKPRAKSATTSGDWAYIHALADLQIGKTAYGEGSDATIARVLDALDRSVARLKIERKRRPVGTVVLAMLGDLCEGSSSIGGAVLLGSDLGVTEQVRVVRRLLLEHVKAFAPLVDRLVIPTAPGNHDQPHRFGGIAPRAHDSWAVDVACQVADALALADGYDHVEVVCPDVDDLTVTIEAAGTIIGLAHGHQIKRGDGHGWWAKQGHSRARIGSADLLLTGHFHHFRAETNAARTWLQAPTVDPGSPHFDQKYGGRSVPGTMTLMTSGGAWSSLEIL